MSVDVDELLSLLVPDYINKNLLIQHDMAREAFRNVPIVVPDYEAFADLIAEYVQYHHAAVGEGTPSPEAAFGEGRRILMNFFADDPYQEGYTIALQSALDGSGGGMRMIVNTLADQLKSQALHAHKDFVFHKYVNVLSAADNQRLAAAYFARFGGILRKFQSGLDEKTFAGNVRAAIDYHLRIVEEILKVGRRM